MLQPDRFFEDQENILADSAYTPSRTVIPAYKEHDYNAVIPLNQRRRFNRELSKMRVGIEHAPKSISESPRSPKPDQLQAYFRACPLSHPREYNSSQHASCAERRYLPGRI